MPTIEVNDVEICYESFGPDDAPPLLLVTAQGLMKRLAVDELTGTPAGKPAIKLKPGESRRVGDVIVRLSACERTAPWEMPGETGAFVQVLVRDTASDDDNRWLKIFSGWLFKRSPSLNVVEHPVYDVWVKDCAMSFPGEEAPVASPSGRSSGSTAPAATPSPSASPAPAAPAPAANTEA